MKTRTRQNNSARENNPTKPSEGAEPTVEEIRQRAQEIFEARGGAPGNELFDWLRAEQQLKQERAGSKAHDKSGGDLRPGSTIPRALGIIGAVLLAILLNGCASAGGAGDPDPWTYNPNTGYPAVGAPSLGHSL